jgi:hypothetical protein
MGKTKLEKYFDIAASTVHKGQSITTISELAGLIFVVDEKVNMAISEGRILRKLIEERIPPQPKSPKPRRPRQGS